MTVISVIVCENGCHVVYAVPIEGSEYVVVVTVSRCGEIETSVIQP